MRIFNPIDECVYVSIIFLPWYKLVRIFNIFQLGLDVYPPGLLLREHQLAAGPAGPVDAHKQQLPRQLSTSVP